MKLDIKKQFQGRSFRVKGVDLHPTEPWLLCSLFTGTVQIWNYDTGAVLRTFEASNMPVRACRFIARKNWIAVGGDDMQVRIFNYNTSEKVTQFEAHVDYIRCMAVHPTQPLLLTAGDDMVIKLWNWEQNWRNIETYKGHTSYVMSIAFNPKDPNTFASACMDRTVKVWSLGSPVPNFTLVAHESNGVNYVDYYPFGDKPYLITTSDDKTIKIFDYQSKSCIATLTGHSHNVSFAIFHPELPIIISGSEDSTVKVWNARSYKLEQTLNYGMERVWCVATRPNSNSVAMGFETGSLLLKFGSDTPAVSMDHSGKLVWAKHLEAFSATIKPSAEGGDETALNLTPKDLGTIDMHPSQLEHSPNGRFVAVCGDGEYIIYTALAWRNKMFGEALDFAWGADSSDYAVRVNDGSIRAYKNFTERAPSHFSIEFEVSKIYGGTLLGVAGDDFIAFYDWESGEYVSRVDVVVTEVIWADSGELVTVVSEDSFYILRFDRDAVSQALISEADLEDGVEDAFEVLHDGTEKIQTAKWVGDCFIFVTSSNRLSYLVGSEVYNISHFDKEMYLLGYIPRDNAIYLCDKDIHVSSLKLSLAVVEYQTVVLRGDLDYAQSELLPKIPEDERNRVARFLDTQGFKEYAIEVSKDSDHKFELALELGNLALAKELALAQSDNKNKFRALGDVFLKTWQVSEAEEAFSRAGDLETLLLIYTSTGDKDKLHQLAKNAVDQGKYNLAFNAFWYTGDVDSATELLLRSGRAAEASMFSLTWGGNVEKSVDQWKSLLEQGGRGAIAEGIADPKSFGSNLHEKVLVRPQVGEDDLIDLDATPAPESTESKAAVEESVPAHSEEEPAEEAPEQTVDEASEAVEKDTN